MVFLDTQAWYSHKTDESFSHQLTEAVSMLVENFRAPLEAKATDLAAIQEEAKEMLDYAHQYLRVDRDGYQHVWYRLAEHYFMLCSHIKSVMCHIKFEKSH